ncbi:MAG TPA: Tad domain-containing protein, partial [Nitrospiraceae bacterium]
MLTKTHSESGASAILIALMLVVLLGMAAVAIDLSAGFNERRQDQTSADMAVMAGALEASFLISDNTAVAQQVVALAEPNLTTSYSLADYQTIWRGCSDSAMPAGFFPLPDPWGGAGIINCISRSSSFLRVRVPDQLTPTTFGRVLGATNLTTNAIAIAIIRPGTNNAPIVPYGISGAAGSGELCFGTSGSGTAFPPCSGPSSGTFGTLLSEFFGDFYGSAGCGNPGAPEIRTATALGIDHFVGIWPNPGGGVSPGDPHPGDGTVLGLPETNRDSCSNSGGQAVADDGVPLNTMKVDTGFPTNAMFDGLVSNMTFFGQPARLRQTGVHPVAGTPVTNTTRDLRSGNSRLPLDNHGPWDYLNGAGPSTCDPSGYLASLTEVQKAARFNACIADYVSSGSTTVIFDELVAESPRFAWAPQYWYDLPTTGLSWEPIMAFRMVFIAGTYFNCNSTSCGIVFYPDKDYTTELCDPGGPGGCKNLNNMSQFSAWVLADAMIPDSVKNSFPGGTTPFAP